MSVKQDRTHTRTAQDLERKYDFGHSISEAKKIAEEARRIAESLGNQISEGLAFDKLAVKKEISIGNGKITPTSVDMHENGYFGNLSVSLPQKAEYPATAHLGHPYGGQLSAICGAGRVALTGLTAPVDASDATNKEYVDTNCAPAGYGLGQAKLISVEEIDTTTAPGFYNISGAMTVNNVTANYWYMIVGAYGNGTNHCVQKLYPVTAYRVELMRFSQIGVWYEWECVNPPMVIGTAYRTTERYNGKAVYAKLIDFGAMPNAANKNVAHATIADQTVISLQGVLSNGVPFSSGYNQSRSAPTVKFWVDATNWSIRILTEGDMSSVTATILVKYIEGTQI